MTAPIKDVIESARLACDCFTNKGCRNDAWTMKLSVLAVRTLCDRTEEEVSRLKIELAIAEAKNRSSLANNLCPDHRDKQQGKPCLACTVEQLQTKILKKDMDR